MLIMGDDLQQHAVQSHRGRLIYVGKLETAGLIGMITYKRGNNLVLRDKMLLLQLPIPN